MAGYAPPRSATDVGVIATGKKNYLGPIMGLKVLLSAINVKAFDYYSD